MVNSFGIRDRLGVGGPKDLKESDLIQLHHDFMMCYGWIPVEEFKKLKCQTFWNLNEKCQKEKAKREQLRMGLLQGAGMKKEHIIKD